MWNAIKQIMSIVGTIATIVGVFYGAITFYEGRTKLTYSISERILFENSINEKYIQKITIRNSGEKKLNNIVVKSNFKVDDLLVLKFSSVDSCYIDTSNNKLELIYNELPPLAEMSIIFKTIENERGDVSITSDETIAFEKDDTKIYIIVIIILFSLLLSCPILYIYINGKKDLFYLRSSYNPDQILKMKKPFYLNGHSWDGIMELAKKIETLNDRKNQ